LSSFPFVFSLRLFPSSFPFAFSLRPFHSPSPFAFQSPVPSACSAIPGTARAPWPVRRSARGAHGTGRPSQCGDRRLRPITPRQASQSRRPNSRRASEAPRRSRRSVRTLRPCSRDVANEANHGRLIEGAKASDARGDDHASVTSDMDDVGVAEKLNNDFIAEGRGGSRRSQRTSPQRIKQNQIPNPRSIRRDSACARSFQPCVPVSDCTLSPAFDMSARSGTENSCHDGPAQSR